MLKVAKVFKQLDFGLDADGHPSVLSQPDILNVLVKNDNFVSSVDISTQNAPADLFDYKYITFDGEALFEITDCVSNGSLYTIFVQYLTNIKCDGTVDDNFTFIGQTPARLRELGLTTNDLLQIFGDNVTQTRISKTNLSYCVKIRFSEIPQNLKTGIYAIPQENGEAVVGTVSVSNVDKFGHSDLGNRSYTAFSSSDDIPKSLGSARPFQTLGTDNAYAVYIPVPLQKGGDTDIPFSHMVLWLYDNRPEATTRVQRLNMDLSEQNFFYTLNALITDLTLSVELVPTAIPLLYARWGAADRALCPINIYFTGDGTIIGNPHNFISNELIVIQKNQEPIANGYIRIVSSETLSVRYPVFFCEAGAKRAIADTESSGFIEYRGYTRLDLSDSSLSEDDTIYSSFSIMGNVIDFADIRSNIIYLQLYNQKIRIWLNEEINKYIDISNTLEFAQNAYSNYEAYTKSNVELLNRFQSEVVEQQIKQNDKAAALSILQQSTYGLAGIGFAAASGNIAGVVTAGVGTALNAGFSAIKSEQQNQNAIANQRLSAQHNLIKARATRVPSSELQGSVSLNEFIKQISMDDAFSVLTLAAYQLTPYLRDRLYQYALSNSIIELNASPSFRMIQWKPATYTACLLMFDTKITQNRKGLTVFGSVVQ